MDASVSDELVADHEWEALLHTFDPEADEQSRGGEFGEEGEELWERLSSTRWLKAPETEVQPASPNSETTALNPEPGI